ncbi:MAG: class I SAM-dependent methyltransferase [Acidobacteria bacterium]|nr:MAG: class I SAM-dependent methyltransferase [Acidobacteriota bacterium]
MTLRQGNPSPGWDRIYAENGRFFTQPHEALPEMVNLLKARSLRRVLDLGCGSGRHLVPLARAGFSVFGFDNSTHGLLFAREDLAKEQLKTELQLGDFRNPLPYRDGSFDAVLSIQVIHHADTKTIERVVAEIGRILAPGGLLFLTVPKFRNQATSFRQIEARTFVPEDGPEKGLPHHYFDEGELRELLRGFQIFSFNVDSATHYSLFAWHVGSDDERLPR